MSHPRPHGVIVRGACLTLVAGLLAACPASHPQSCLTTCGDGGTVTDAGATPVCDAGGHDNGAGECVSSSCVSGYAPGPGGDCELVSDDAARLVVQPVFFVPTDAALSDADEATARQRLRAMLLIVERRWKSLLGSDTFLYSVAEPLTYRALKSAAAYAGADANAPPDSAHLMAKELLDWKAENRNQSRNVFVALFVRSAVAPCGGAIVCMGGGRPFNGGHDNGGGFVQMELSALLSDDPYPFLSTLPHELGHAFGLTHSDCEGEDLSTGQSIMSYNPAHHSSGFIESATPGVLLPEELYVLDQQKLGFPHYAYDSSIDNPTGRPLADVTCCEIAAMDATLGPMDRLGFQLFRDGVLVSGPGAQFYTRCDGLSVCSQAVAMATDAGGTQITCSYDGKVIGGN